MKPALAGSIARETFAAARQTLGQYLPDQPFRAPAIAYRVAAAERRFRLGPRASRYPPKDSIGYNQDLLRRGQISAVELATRALAAIERRQAELNAFVTVDTDGALAAARQLDGELATGRWRGPLHGMPFSVKDVIDVAGLPTRAGCDAYLRLPAHDASAVARLRAAGAVLLGKTTTHQFALGVTTPQSRNPHDSSRLAGGSSGGSAIAVATGMGHASLGTDTRASIRVPAALCGVVGFKPTYGSLPLDGVVTLSWTMDHVAPLARCVEDAALVLSILLQRDDGLGQAAGAGVRGLRIGVPPASLEGAEPVVRSLFDNGLRVLQEAGCEPVEVPRPSAADFEAASAAGLIISRCEAAAVHRHLDLHRDAYWQEVAEQLEEAANVAAADYLDAQRLRAELAEAMLAAMDEVDLLAMPTTLSVAPPAEDFARFLYVLSRNAIPWSLIGFPAMSVPCGLSPEGLPAGLQLVGAPGAEDLLVAAGSALEAAIASQGDGAEPGPSQGT